MVRRAPPKLLAPTRTQTLAEVFVGRCGRGREMRQIRTRASSMLTVHAKCTVAWIAVESLRLFAAVRQ